MRRSLKSLVGHLLVVSLVVQLCSCGTLLYPERVGQKGGRVDPGVAVLDGLGLLLFIVPGVVAFIVDFSNGAIYLPGTYGQAGEEAEGRYIAIKPDAEVLGDREIEIALSEHLGQTVDLDSPEAEVIRVEICPSLGN